SVPANSVESEDFSVAKGMGSSRTSLVPVIRMTVIVWPSRGKLSAGTEVVAEQGKEGMRKVTYALRTVNGVKQKPKKIAEEVVREPEKQVVKVGTKPLPT
ncbi:G5 domain-containing protein, partial [Streptomyces beijiangensis]|nr:G5 domain-containing protein [Streptomyces beijiangensis]